MSDTRDLLKYALLDWITEEFRSDAGIDVDAYLAHMFRRAVEKDGCVPYGNPSHEWLDMEAPENTFMRAMNTFTDEETGETWGPPARWLVRTSGRCYKA